MTQDLSEQFYGNFEIAPWILNSLNMITQLKNKKEPNVINKNNITELNMWVIGPKEQTPEKLFLYGHSEYGSVEKEIIYIKKDENEPFIIVYCKPGYLYKLMLNKSASMIAKKLDMLLNGSYTKIALIHHEEIIERLCNDL